MVFKISEPGMRDIINLTDGAKLGPVRDVYIDLGTGRVQTLVLSSGEKYLGLFRAGGEVTVPWDDVKKIGVDTV